eukprot:TRINITY_DN5504_c0_g1_i2.p1 TRINITY_DN5504_c0_g1~~TRINITY_DN5504_c0_g1_i2.p1  ORF type:complete len:161 (+),score=20.52 TRINITY_DN5504_c0_g1_i2:239-721(+)
MRFKMTKNIQTAYLQSNMFYSINVLHFDVIDNIDQRIADDSKSFTESLATILSSLLTSIILIGMLFWNFVEKVGYRPPLLLFGFFLVSVVVLGIIVTKIGRLTFRQDKLEGFYRESHIHVRDHSESIAFYNGEHIEKDYVDTQLERVLKNCEQLSTTSFS